MKHAKKLAGLLLALIMMLGMSAAAMAATITIDPNQPSDAESSAPVYTYYQMMKASLGNNDLVSYYVETKELADALKGLKVGTDDLFTVTQVGTTNHWNVTINKKANNTDFSGEEVAGALATITDKAIVTGTAANNQITIEGDGYVLIESSLGTKLVVDTFSTQTVTEKNTYPSSKKEVDTTTAEIGEAVTYTVTVEIPVTVAKKTITIYDTISKGLTLDTAVTVTGAAASSAYTSAVWSENTAYTSADEKQYTITIPAEIVSANAGKTLTFTYTATVNKDAVVNDPETNKAHIEYDHFVSKDVEVEVKTFGFELLKTDSSANPLAGVKFTLTNVAGEFYIPEDKDRFQERTVPVEVTTDSNGKITFSGLKQGIYTLTETETLAGYNLLAGAITVTIDKDGKATFSGPNVTGNGNVVTIVNKSGSLLPSTGGIGTTIFYTVGSILLIGAAILLIVRRRMKAAE